MGNSKRPCKQCKKWRPADKLIKRPAGSFCDNDNKCVMAFIQDAQERDKKRKLAKVNADNRRKAKAARAKHKSDKERVKPLSKLLSETQSVINRYVRLRDQHLGCVSCDKPAEWHGQWHASHFHPHGRSSRLRFNLWNIHKSCSVCNSHLSGNLRHYEPELVRRIGNDKFNWMEAHASDITKYDAGYLRRLKRVFSKKCRAVKNNQIAD